MKTKFNLGDDLVHDGTERGTVIGIYCSEPDSPNDVVYTLRNGFDTDVRAEEDDLELTEPLELVTYRLPATLILYVDPLDGVVRMTIQPAQDAPTLSDWGPDCPTLRERIATRHHLANNWPVIGTLGNDVEWEG